MHHPIRHLLTGMFSMASIVEALSGSNVLAISTGVVAIVTALWSAWRQERRKDFDLVEYQKMVTALVDAKVKAINAGQPDPWPHLTVPGFPVPNAEEPKSP